MSWLPLQMSSKNSGSQKLDCLSRLTECLSRNFHYTVILHLNIKINKKQGSTQQNVVSISRLTVTALFASFPRAFSLGEFEFFFYLVNYHVNPSFIFCPNRKALFNSHISLYNIFWVKHLDNELLKTFWTAALLPFSYCIIWDMYKGVIFFIPGEIWQGLVSSSCRSNFIIG
jgi:hypothetical protein